MKIGWVVLESKQPKRCNRTLEVPRTYKERATQISSAQTIPLRVGHYKVSKDSDEAVRP